MRRLLNWIFGTPEPQAPWIDPHESCHSEISWLREQLVEEKRRVAHLQEVIFARFGITQAASPIEKTHHEPIGRSGESWPRRKERLEREDAKVAKSQSEDLFDRMRARGAKTMQEVLAEEEGLNAGSQS